jgi:hypothetical protein
MKRASAIDNAFNFDEPTDINDTNRPMFTPDLSMAGSHASFASAPDPVKSLAPLPSTTDSFAMGMPTWDAPVTSSVTPSAIVPSASNVDALLFMDFGGPSQAAATKPGLAKEVSLLDSAFEDSSFMTSQLPSGAASNANTSNNSLLDFAEMFSTSADVSTKSTASLNVGSLNFGHNNETSHTAQDFESGDHQKVFVGSLYNRGKGGNEGVLRNRDRQTFSMNDNDEDQRAGIWKQPFFHDLFTGAIIKRTETKSDIPPLTRLANAFHAVRLAIGQIKGLARRDNEISELLSLVSSSFKEARDVCNEIPVNANDHQKFSDFLARFMSRIKHLRQGEITISPCIWSVSSTTVDEPEGGGKKLVHEYHGVVLLVYRTNESGNEDFSVTVVNTGKDNGGLCYHAAEVDSADGSLLYNLAFELVNIPNSRVQNTAFWYVYINILSSSSVTLILFA